jgi:hypothetical protein
MTTVEMPPVIHVDNYTGESELGNSIHFYLDYEYLPIRNISTMMKSVNELYELVYFIINDTHVPQEDKLVLSFAATGNSFDWVGTVLSQFRSKKAKVAILIVAGLIYTPIGIEKYRTDVANRGLIDAQTEHTIAQKAKTNAETASEKAKEALIKAEEAKKKAETESIDLDNLYKKNKMKEDSIAKLNSEKNRKKIMRKRSSIRRAAQHPAINICVVNNVNISSKE